MPIEHNFLYFQHFQCASNDIFLSKVRNLPKYGDKGKLTIQQTFLGIVPLLGILEPVDIIESPTRIIFEHVLSQKIYSLFGGGDPTLP